MPKFYTAEKGKYGGIVGTIHCFTSQLPPANDPIAFKPKLPAGFLRCDGSILNASSYPALADVLGVGSLSKFAKDPTTLLSTQFQLPDLGSKYMVPGNSSGTYLSTYLSDGTTRRVGAEFEITSNVGTSETISWSGNFSVGGANDRLTGNPLYAGPSTRVTSQAVLTDTNFQGHGHLANQQVFNFTGNYVVEQSIPSNSSTASACRPYGGNALYFIRQPDGASGAPRHEHTITLPTASSSYTHNFRYTYPTTSIPPTALRTTVNITTSAVKTFDSTVAPFILIEYIIKF